MKVDYIALSVPIFFLLIGIELTYDFFKKLGYYRLNDSMSNLSQGIGQQITGLFFKTILFFGYKYIFEHWRLLDLPNAVWVWIILFLGIDFFYYWFHRMSHQVNALWAAHIVHHQSEEYNLTVALRQSWFQGWFSWIFYLPLAFLGFDPIMFLTLSAFNTLYQFWIHTRTIKSLGFLEYIINTPSHHRVHHGSNPKYIDKNHAGTLIIWDRMFGTFQKEEEEVYYGITKPLSSWNPFWANFHYWADLWYNAKNAGSVKEKLQIYLKSPGWQPKSLTAEVTDSVIIREKYDAKGDLRMMVYAAIIFALNIVVSALVLFKAASLPIDTLILIAVYILVTLTSCGAILEKRKWTFWIENIRLIFSGILLLLYNPFVMPNTIIIILIGVQFISMIIFNIINRPKNVKKIP